MSSAAVHEPTGQAKDLVADAAGDGELSVGMETTEARRPAGQVAGEHGASQPGGVGEEAPGRTVQHPCAFFEIADGELDSGMVALELVCGDDVGVEVGHERVVAPVWPQGLLSRVGEPRASV